MRGQRWFAIGLVAVLYGIISGCQSCRPTPDCGHPRAWPGQLGRRQRHSHRRRHTSIAATENRRLGRAPPTLFQAATIWETSGDNKIVKAAAATFVGVPVGFYGEVKQIIVGVPTEPRY